MSPYRFYGMQRFLLPDGTVLKCKVPPSPAMKLLQQIRQNNTRK